MTYILDYARAIVSDGIIIGHPCCNVAHCEVALANKRHRYCPEHAYLNAVCSVEGCTKPIVAGTLSCDIPEHVLLYSNYKKRKNAKFQRKKAKNKVTSTAKPPNDNILTDSGSITTLYDTGDVDDLLGDDALETLNIHHNVSAAASDASADVNFGVRESAGTSNPPLVCPQKSDEGIRQLRACAGRRQTHSEQFMARPCGVIVARATFYGSEPVPQTVVSSHITV